MNETEEKGEFLTFLKDNYQYFIGILVAIIFLVFNKPVIISINALLFHGTNSPYLSDFINTFGINPFNQKTLFVLIALFGFLAFFISPYVPFLLKQGWRFKSIKEFLLLISISFSINTIILSWAMLCHIPINKLFVALAPTLLSIILILLPSNIMPKITKPKLKQTKFFAVFLIIFILSFLYTVYFRLLVLNAQNVLWSDGIVLSSNLLQMYDGTFFNHPNDWGPLQSLISTVFYNFTGDEVLAMQFTSFIASILIPFVCMGIFILLSNDSYKEHVLFVGFIALLYPLANALSTYNLQDSLLTLLTSLTVFSFLYLFDLRKEKNYLNQKRIQVILSFLVATTITAAALTRYSHGVVIILFVIIMGIFFIKNFSNFKWNGAAFTLGGIVIAIPWIARQIHLHNNPVYSPFYSIFSWDLGRDGLIYYFNVLTDYAQIGIPLMVLICGSLVTPIIIKIWEKSKIHIEKRKGGAEQKSQDADVTTKTDIETDCKDHDGELVINKTKSEREIVKRLKLNYLYIGFIILLWAVILAPLIFYYPYQIRYTLTILIFIPIFLGICFKNKFTQIASIFTIPLYFYVSFREASFWYVIEGLGLMTNYTINYSRVLIFVMPILLSILLVIIIIKLNFFKSIFNRITKKG